MQFAGQGVGTLVTTKMDLDVKRLSNDIKVLAIDTDSRHDKPAAAYAKVAAVVKRTAAAGVGAIYKKTDSALRGNVGAELTAVYDGAGIKQLPFVPAYPLNNRITVDGCQYVDGIPVHKTNMGRDIFSPVNSALIADIIHSQSEIPVAHKSPGEKPVDMRGICVYNAASEEELNSIGDELAGRGEINITAGCAGFARYLLKLLGLKVGGNTGKIRAGGGKTLLICGSINAVSMGQMSYLKQKGCPVVTLYDYLDGEDFAGRAAKTAVDMLAHSDTVIVESLKEAVTLKEQGAAANGGRLAIVSAFARLTRKILEGADVKTLFVIGGDTLRGIADEMNFDGIIPQTELAAGVVLGRVNGENLNIVSKSGGFGDGELVYKVLKELK